MAKKPKLIVGLTGVFGTGKTTVGHLMEELGACLIEADKLAHEALWKGGENFKKVAEAFPEAVKENGDLDRRKIAGIVFKNKKRRVVLEDIVHPYILARMQEDILGASESVVVLDVPLLFETKFHKLCDLTVVVSAPANVLKKRLIEKGFAPEDIKLRLAVQMPLKEKVKRADYVINNAKSLKETKAQVAKVWKKISEELKSAENKNKKSA